MTRHAALDGRVALDVRAGVAFLELRRAEKRNAMTAEMWVAMAAHLEGAAAESSIRALVLRGSGGFFCAGADLTAVKDADGSTALPYRHLAVSTIEALAAFPVPTIAGIEGPCIGAGSSLALACDLRFATPGTTFGIPAVRHRLIYDEGSISRLVALVGPSHAAQILYGAVPIDGARALAIGLVNECVEDVDAALSRFLDALLMGDPTTVTATRTILRAISQSS